MRGKLVDDLHGAAVERIIPAHAGQTCACPSRPRAWTDHPRACGANDGLPNTYRSLGGSSPRMRGKLSDDPHGIILLRIIPAHAGQTPAQLWMDSLTADHPRACGANVILHLQYATGVGSSPRMRGKLIRIHLNHLDLRIIPAHAGQTSACSRYRHWSADHPRACGANSLSLMRARATSGSSPRMRGKHVANKPLEIQFRIIPAHAGQTTAPWALELPTADHPRACGANLLIAADWADGHGSSPRMRGKPLCQGRTVWGRRIIPAHAGQTSGADCTTGAPPDHPRACGANRDVVRIIRRASGSSPRMRGKRVALECSSFGRRIIPAHAGQTQ